MSHKFQITLPDDLAAELKLEAARMDVPLAELIRETMRERLQKKSLPREEENPLAAITGIVDVPETELSSRVDEVLYR